MHRVSIRDTQHSPTSSSDGDDYNNGDYDGNPHQQDPATARSALVADSQHHRSVSAAHTADRDEQAAFHEYLFSFGDQYAAHKEALRAAHEAQVMSTLQAVPRISPHAQAKVRDAPIEQRLFELQKKRAERLEDAKRRINEDRQAKALEECKGYTGHPEITPWAQQLKRRSNGETIAESSAKWIEEHKKRMAALQEDALKRELAELRPTPRISSGSVASTAPAASHPELPIEERLTLQERERQRRMYALVEKEMLDAKRNAKPQINTTTATQRHRSNSAATDGNATTTAASEQATDVVSRLYNPHYKVPAYDPELVEKCTFQPRVYSRVDPNDELMKLPVHERLLKRHENAKESHVNKTIQQARLQAAADNIGTPRISAKSRQLASMKASPAASLSSSARFGGSPTDRLYNDAKVRQEQLAAKVQKRRAESADPKPKLSKKSQEMLSHNPLFVTTGSVPAAAAAASESGSPSGGKGAASTVPPAQSFAARQRLYDRKRADLERQRKAERHAQEEAELEQCTFRPEFDRVREETRLKGKAKVSPNQDSVLRRRPVPSAGVENDFYLRNERWMTERERRIAAAKEAKQQLELAECDFHPTIHAEVPLPSSTVYTAPGLETHVKRQLEARREREIKEAGGLQALQRKQAAEAAAATGVGPRRTTVPESFDFHLPANQAAVEGGAAQRTPRTARSRHHDTSASLTSLRPPVTAADVEAFYEHGQQHQHQQYVQEEEAPYYQYQQGYQRAHYAPSNGADAVGHQQQQQHGGFFGGAYGDAPRSASAQSQASSVSRAYDMGVAALAHQPAVGQQGWGGGVSVEAIIRNHQDIYRRTAAAAAAAPLHHGGR